MHGISVKAADLKQKRNIAQNVIYKRLNNSKFEEKITIVFHL